MKNKFETFVREHTLATGIMVVAVATIAYQRAEIKALTSFTQFLTQEVK